MGALRQLLLGFAAAIRADFWQLLMLVLAVYVECLVQSWHFLVDLAIFGGLGNAAGSPAAARAWFCTCNLHGLLATIETCSCGTRGVVGAVLVFSSGGLGNIGSSVLVLAWFCRCNTRRFLATIDACSCKVLGAVLAFWGWTRQRALYPEKILTSTS